MKKNIEINQQFPLALKLDSSATFANYWAEADAQALAALQQLAQSAQGSWIYLAGPAGSGVSHLLQASSAAAVAAGFSVMVLSLSELIAAGKSLGADEVAGYFDTLENADLLCIDDIDCLVDQPQWQEHLFYLLEKLKNKPGSRLLIGSHSVAAQLPLTLADLKSRLMWATGFTLQTLDDEQKCNLLRFKAKGLGLDMSAEVARFLLNRCSRNVGDLLAVLVQLDKLAMSSGRRLTIPWIKSVLEI